MADNTNNCCGCGCQNNKPNGPSQVCINCDRIMDSCKDKDCYEDVKVYLTDCGQEVIEKGGSIRCKSANIVWTTLIVEPVQFSCGFYQIYVKFYVKMCFEVCMSPGQSQIIEGIAVCEKKVILYGGEGNVHIFRSNPFIAGFCSVPEKFSEQYSNNLPVAVCETVDPICLDVKIVTPNKRKPCCNCCCCCVDEIPQNVCCQVNGSLIETGDQNKELYVSLGFFSVIRIEREGQFTLNATEYCVPEKECTFSNDSGDPFAMFKNMPFPTDEFCHRSCGCDSNGPCSSGGCGCPGGNGCGGTTPIQPRMN